MSPSQAATHRTTATQEVQQLVQQRQEPSLNNVVHLSYRKWLAGVLGREGGEAVTSSEVRRSGSGAVPVYSFFLSKWRRGTRIASCCVFPGSWHWLLGRPRASKPSAALCLLALQIDPSCTHALICLGQWVGGIVEASPGMPPPPAMQPMLQPRQQRGILHKQHPLDLRHPPAGAAIIGSRRAALCAQAARRSSPSTPP